MIKIRKGPGAKAGAKRKYNNRKVSYSGLVFDSAKERDRYIYLLGLEAENVIKGLERQIKFELIPAVRETYIKHLKTKDKELSRTLQRAITYTCDFRYIFQGKEVIEDVKASPKMIPNEYLLKEKIFFWKYGKRIKRVYEAKETL